MAEQHDFEKSLEELIDEHLEAGGQVDDVISALELKLAGLKEEMANAEKGEEQGNG